MQEAVGEGAGGYVEGPRAMRTEQYGLKQSGKAS